MSPQTRNTIEGIKAFMYPILLSVVSVFLYGAYNNQNDMMKTQTKILQILAEQEGKFNGFQIKFQDVDKTDEQQDNRLQFLYENLEKRTANHSYYLK